MNWLDFFNKRSHFILSACFILIVAAILRFFNITSNEFLFYDEGMYLNFNLAYLQKVTQFRPDSFDAWFQIFGVLSKSALATAKALWFWLANMRIFFGAYDDYFFLRIVSAISGLLTVVVTYLFAKRYYQSTQVAIIAAIIIAFLPSHIFYSRLAMQESFSTLFFVLGMYLYTFGRQISWRTILAAICFGAVFFTNYRMIILPIYIVLWEGISYLATKQLPDWRKIVWGGVTFLALIFLVGGSFGGQGTYVTFGWMFHQSHMAQSQFDLINFFSYPYYLFKLEGLIFALLFFTNIYFLVKQKWHICFPFAIGLMQMLLFSFAAEKGARYICVMLPFIVMAVAYALVFLYQKFSTKGLRVASLAVFVLMVSLFLPKAFGMLQFNSSYDDSIKFVRQKDPSAKFISTQAEVQKLFVSNSKDVMALPKDAKSLIVLFMKGYRYLVIDPQVYITWSEGHVRWKTQLLGHLQFLETRVSPIKTFDHINGVVLERFVLDHNEHLGRSINFLNNHQDLGKLRVYDLQMFISLLRASGQLEKVLK